jgi:hypothetical protein
MAGAPGGGTSGTAGDYTATFRVVGMQYSWAYAYSLTFVSITSVAQILPAEANGELEIINAGAPRPLPDLDDHRPDPGRDCSPAGPEAPGRALCRASNRERRAKLGRPQVASALVPGQTHEFP